MRENNTGRGTAQLYKFVHFGKSQFGRVNGYCEKVWLVDLAECTKYDWLMQLSDYSQLSDYTSSYNSTQ